MNSYAIHYLQPTADGAFVVRCELIEARSATLALMQFHTLPVAASAREINWTLIGPRVPRTRIPLEAA